MGVGTGGQGARRGKGQVGWIQQAMRVIFEVSTAVRPERYKGNPNPNTRVAGGLMPRARASKRTLTPLTALYPCFPSCPPPLLLPLPPSPHTISLVIVPMVGKTDTQIGPLQAPLPSPQPLRPLSPPHFAPPCLPLPPHLLPMPQPNNQISLVIVTKVGKADAHVGPCSHSSTPLASFPSMTLLVIVTKVSKTDAHVGPCPHVVGL